MAGKPNAIADEKAACCLRRWHLVDVFTDRGTSADAAYPNEPEENAMRQKSKKKLDTIAFTGALLAFIGFLLAWFLATLPKGLSE